MRNELLFVAAKELHKVLVDVSTGTSYDDEDIILSYDTNRKLLMQDRTSATYLPEFVKKYRDLSAFWGFIKNTCGSYADRRLFLADAFSQLLDYLEQSNEPHPIETIIISAQNISNDYIREIWEKALRRLETDPEGAITASRTLIEATCKHILDSSNIDYDDKIDLPQLYRRTAKQLELAPSQHTEQLVKQLLGGAETIVSAISSLRNKISDAHAIGQDRVRPSIRHAMLCVNLAGSISEFLLLTFKGQSEEEWTPFN